MLAVQQNKAPTGDNARKMGRTRKDSPSRELVRFSWLIQQLEDTGFGQKKIADLTGVKISYLNQLKNFEKYGKTGLGTDTLRQIMKGLNLSPSYFFDDYEGQQDHKLHLLSAKRDEKRVSAIEHGLAEAERERAQQRTELAQLREQLVEQRQDVAAMKADLRRVLDALNAHAPRGTRARKAAS